MVTSWQIWFLMAESDHTAGLLVESTQLSLEIETAYNFGRGKSQFQSGSYSDMEMHCLKVNDFSSYKQRL